MLILFIGALAACTRPAAPPMQPAPGSQAADLVLLGGELMTMDPERPRAQALAVRGDRIVAVGSDAEVKALIGPHTRVLELGGHTVTPGLVDGHCHLYGLGMALETVDLRGAASADEAAARVAKAAAELPEGAWVTGRGWDQNLWASKEFPHHRTLDAAVGERPAALRRIDGHALWANAAALRLAGIGRDTPDPAGGRIVRDSQGMATGVLVDAAMELVEARIPPADAATIERRIARAAQVAVEHGLTGVHEMGISDEVAAVYRALAGNGSLPLRVNGYLEGSPAVLAGLAQRTPEPDTTGTALFALRGVKVYADGALGSRGAALLRPYSDDPKNTGLWITEPAELTQIARVAAESGWQLAIHAIGDAANRAVLDAYQAAQAAHPGPGEDVRFRVEHAQVLAAEDMARFGKLGVLASMQPTHATSDMPWAPARLGQERVTGAYAWRSVMAGGGRIVAGSDFPVEEVPPLMGIYAAVTRQDAQGQPPGGWQPEQRLTLEEAVQAFTVGPAVAGFVEHARGVLRTGYVADITVYDRRLEPDASLLTTRVRATIVGGRIVFERK